MLVLHLSIHKFNNLARAHPCLWIERLVFSDFRPCLDYDRAARSKHFALLGFPDGLELNSNRTSLELSLKDISLTKEQFNLTLHRYEICLEQLFYQTAGTTVVAQRTQKLIPTISKSTGGRENEE
jgi:hypothetical protein